MNIELTPVQKALQQEVREYMKTVMTPELLQETKNPITKRVADLSFASNTHAWEPTDGSD